MTTRSEQLKLLGVLVVTALALWSLWPSYEYYTKTPAQRSAMEPAKLADLRKRAIKLGLDAQDIAIPRSLRKRAIKLGLDLQGGLQLLLEVDKSRLSPAEAKDAVERARQIIHNRIDQYGVAEPLVQIEGEDRITVQLPGLTDREVALDLIGKTARLDFKLVRTG